MDKRTEEILNKIYNLILDTDIHKNERDILLSYKTLLENTKNEQRGCHGVGRSSSSAGC